MNLSSKSIMNSFVPILDPLLGKSKIYLLLIMLSILKKNFFSLHVKMINNIKQNLNKINSANIHQNHNKINSANNTLQKNIKEKKTIIIDNLKR